MIVGVTSWRCVLRRVSCAVSLAVPHSVVGGSVPHVVCLGLTSLVRIVWGFSGQVCMMVVHIRGRCGLIVLLVRIIRGLCGGVSGRRGLTPLLSSHLPRCVLLATAGLGATDLVLVTLVLAVGEAVVLRSRTRGVHTTPLNTDLLLIARVVVITLVVRVVADTAPWCLVVVGVMRLDCGSLVGSFMQTYNQQKQKSKLYDLKFQGKHTYRGKTNYYSLRIT